MKNLILTMVTFFCVLNGYSFNPTQEQTALVSQIQRVRVNFTSSNGYTRHLLLGFTPDDAASDGFDFGYDALNIDNFPDDMNWIIEDERYVTQGVGHFDNSKVYPLGLFISNSGEIEISLQALENFDEDIDVYIYDSLNNVYSRLNDNSLTMDLNEGDHVNRFFITFSNTSMANELLSIKEQILSELEIHHHKDRNQLVIHHSSRIIDLVVIYDFNGKELYNSLRNTTNSITLTTQSILSNKPLIVNLRIGGVMIPQKIALR